MLSNFETRWRSRVAAAATLGTSLWFILILMCALPLSADTSRPGLETGFQRLYDLDFPGAQQEFASWEKIHPENAMGPVSQAAGTLFSEFNRLGVLESQFYESDSVFAGRKQYQADGQQKALFEQQLSSAEALAKVSLSRDPKNRDALLAMTLASGLRSDYAALIEKRNVASLRYSKESSAWAAQLLAADPTCYDAHLAGGITKYIVGSMAAPVRWFLRLGGVPADKAGGLDDLRTVAAQGQLLAPFARILLAIAYVRDKDIPRARDVLRSLEKEFPNNPLFSRELARLEKPPAR